MFCLTWRCTGSLSAIAHGELSALEQTLLLENALVIIILSIQLNRAGIKHETL